MRTVSACFLLAISLFIASSHPSAQSVQLTILLERMYLDGQVSEEIRKETVTSMHEIWKKYSDWQLVDFDDKQIVFQKAINDISPLAKANGYFGLTKDGTLSIFEGKPTPSSRIIQSFFQIDVKKLESRKQQQLKKGIRVVSKARYEDILAAYRPFALTD
ncbi:MAG: intercompartmental signaling factor BofC [Anoxybacillus sp.]|nr:intercompartmental signaling factor BofC [Anoxybacillus sp.]MCL6587538.1 intercompartmental signaling factor BofC [Anoxybacillus sp.]